MTRIKRIFDEVRGNMTSVDKITLILLLLKLSVDMSEENDSLIVVSGR